MVMVPSTLKSGRAPGGNGPSRLTSTATVPFTGAAAMRVTWPSTIPFLVSMEAFCPGTTSFAWVSAIWICAFNNFGSETRARFVPGVTCWPTSTATACNTPLMPARTCSASSWLLRRLYRAFCWSTRARCASRRACAESLAIRVESIALKLRIAQFQNDRGGLHRVARPQNDAVHPCLRLRWDPADIFRDQRPQAADIQYHGSAADCVLPDRRVVHSRGGRAQARQPVGNPAQHQHHNHDRNDHAASLLRFYARWSLNIHKTTLDSAIYITQLAGLLRLLVRPSETVGYMILLAASYIEMAACGIGLSHNRTPKLAAIFFATSNDKINTACSFPNFSGAP